MFKEREMTKAIKWLIGLYTPAECEGVDMQTLLEFAGCDMSELCIGLRNTVETVYEYSVVSTDESSFEYRGKELFQQRAIHIGISEMHGEESIGNNVSYRKELWLLEDMTFAIVHCVHFGCEDGETKYETFYRTIVKRMEGREDIFIAPDILIDELMTTCVPLWEDEATIYEL